MSTQKNFTKTCLKCNIIKGDYGVFGWTEVLNNINIETVMESANFMLRNPLESDTQFDMLIND